VRAEQLSAIAQRENSPQSAQRSRGVDAGAAGPRQRRSSGASAEPVPTQAGPGQDDVSRLQGGMSCPYRMTRPAASPYGPCAVRLLAPSFGLRDPDSTTRFRNDDFPGLVLIAGSASFKSITSA